MQADVHYRALSANKLFRPLNPYMKAHSSAPRPDIVIRIAQSADDLQSVRTLFEEYAGALGLDLEFQGFSDELGHLPGDYALPDGTLLIAHVGGALAGCCALRPLRNNAYTDACEMKRLYVRPMFRGFGLGRALADRILETAIQIGYASILLDTLDEMESARALYADLGFVEIPPYYANPLLGAHYLRADLRTLR